MGNLVDYAIDTLRWSPKEFGQTSTDNMIRNKEPISIFIDRILPLTTMAIKELFSTKFPGEYNILNGFHVVNPSKRSADLAFRETATAPEIDLRRLRSAKFGSVIQDIGLTLPKYAELHKGSDMSDALNRLLSEGAHRGLAGAPGGPGLLRSGENSKPLLIKDYTRAKLSSSTKPPQYRLNPGLEGGSAFELIEDDKEVIGPAEYHYASEKIYTILLLKIGDNESEKEIFSTGYKKYDSLVNGFYSNRLYPFKSIINFDNAVRTDVHRGDRQWTEAHFDLYTFHLASSITSAQPLAAQYSFRSQRPAGKQAKQFCNFFNSTGKCKPPNGAVCKYLHACKTCEKPGHGQSTCRQAKKQ